MNLSLPFLRTARRRLLALALATAASLAPAARAATITVNNASDPAGYNAAITVGALGGTVTLRDAVNAANNTAGDDTIVFAASLAGQTITLSQIQDTTVGNTALPISSGITVNGLTGNSGITISGGGTLRLFLVLAGGSFTVTDLTLANGNGDRGGAIRNAGTLVVRRCTLRNNEGGFFGGAVYNPAGTGLLENCTIAANAARGGGGVLVDGGTLTLSHCTVRGNSRRSSGGGGGAACQGGTLELRNNIIAGNDNSGLAAFPDDLYKWPFSPVTLIGSYNLIGSTALNGGAVPLVNGVDGNIVGADAKVGPLASNGGPTDTMALLAGSPAFNAGSSAVTTDQRGIARPSGGARDIGAFEMVALPLSITSASSALFPINQASSFTVTASGSPAPTFSIVGTLPDGVTHNGSGVLSGTPSSAAGGTYPLTITASHGFTPDAVQNFTLTVAEVPSLVVTTTADVVNPTDGLTSLREAVAYAATLGGARTVTFTPALAGQTVTLGSGWNGAADASALRVAGTLTIAGITTAPGITLAVDAAVSKRHLLVEGSGNLTLSHLTLTGGRGDFGGAVWSFGSLTLRSCTFTGNHATAEGGAIQSWGDSPLLDIENSTFHGNTTDGLGAAMNLGAAVTTFRHVTITGNPGSSVAVSLWKNQFAFFNSIIAGNGTDGIGSANGGTISAASANNLLGTGGSGGLVHGVNGNLVGVAAAGLNLGTLTSNGGPTPTVSVQAGSPAINAGGVLAGVTTDQRGRPRDASPDIGAFEYRRLLVNSLADPAGFDPGLTLATLGDTITLRDAINAANNAGAAPPIEFDPSLAGQRIDLLQVADTTAGNSALRITSTASIVAPVGGITIARSGSAPGMRLFRVEAGAALALTGVLIRDGNAGDGGAIYNLGTVTMSQSTVRDQVTGGGARGGAIFNGGAGQFSAEFCLFTINRCEGTGGAIHNESTHATGVSLNRCSFLNNYSIGYVLGGNTFRSGGGGGAIYNNGFLTVTACQFGGCQGNIEGGAILNEANGVASVSNCSFELNQAIGVLSNSGGAICDHGTSTVSGCTFLSNSAPIHRGGAIATIGGGAQTAIVNCTFQGNTGFFGNALDASSGGLSLVTHCTLVNNGSGGGNRGVVSVGSGSEARVRNSIVSNPALNPEFWVNGTLVNEGNLIRGVNSDPLLFPIGTHGSPVAGVEGYPLFQFALQAGSPAIDAAAADPGIPVDQRGVARPQGGASDIGAYEFPGPDLDTDGDTLPDAWEYTYLQTLFYDAANDRDDDGFNNATEWMAGSNPNYLPSIPGPTHVSRVYGFGPGRGLDLTGTFAYAFNVGPTGAAGQAGDANFTADSAPGITVQTPNNPIAVWNTPNFGSASADDVLELVYQSIRWADHLAVDPEHRKLRVDLAGLVPGWRYKLQLLFGEAGSTGRRFDVLVDGSLVVNDFAPSHAQGSASMNNAGSAVVHEFVASSSTLQIVLDGTDVASVPNLNRDPYLNGVTLESLQLPPIATADTVNRPTTARVVKVLKSELIENDSDPDGDPLSLIAVADALPAGATVALSGNFVIYTAPTATAGNGSFTYTLSDGIGGNTVIGTVSVTETGSDPGASAPNPVAISTVGNDVTLGFLGVPGRTYGVQYTTDDSPPYAWQEFGSPVNLVAPASGVLSFTDVNPPDPMRLYRAVLRP